MRNTIQVSEIMTTDLHTLSLDQSFGDAQEMFDRLKVRHLPVVDGKRLKGILSLTDIQRLSFGQSFGSGEFETDAAIFEMMTIEQVMKHHPKTVSPENSIADVAEILATEEFHALPVVSGDQLVGIVTTTDIIRFLLDN